MSEQKTANRKKLIEKLREYIGKRVIINNIYEGTLEDAYGEMIFLKLDDGSTLGNDKAKHIYYQGG